MDVRRSMCVGVLLAAAGSGCASPPARPRIEDNARTMAPIPACVTTLAGSRGAPQGMTRSLRGEYWKIVYPGYDEGQHRVPQGVVACTGRSLLQGGEFEGVVPVERAEETDITVGGGADGIKAVWLRSHRSKDGVAAGALALVRARGDSATVFAVGAYRGRPGSQLALERLDSELALLVNDDGCKGRAAGQRCDSMLTVYLIRQGRLTQATRVALERVEYDASSEPAVRGNLEYHLTASPSFVQGMLRLVEHVTVRDQDGREVRWAEQERLYRIDDDQLRPSEDPLWSRMYRPEPQGR